MSAMLNNPEMMKNMENMMNQPQFQELLNNKDLMNSMMGMFGGSNDNMFNQQSSDNTSDNEINDLEIESKKFLPNDSVELFNLKSEKYNNCLATIVSYNQSKDRYVVNLIEDNDGNKDVKIMIKEENIKLETIEDDENTSILEVD